MNVEKIERVIGHDYLVKTGWRQTSVGTEISQRHGGKKETPVLIYKKRKYIHNKGVRINDGAMVRYYNEFGLIATGGS